MVEMDLISSEDVITLTRSDLRDLMSQCADLGMVIALARLKKLNGKALRAPGVVGPGGWVINELQSKTIFDFVTRYTEAEFQSARVDMLRQIDCHIQQVSPRSALIDQLLVTACAWREVRTKDDWYANKSIDAALIEVIDLLMS